MRIGIIVLALATAIIHVVLAIPETIVPFFLNALGYLVLVTALYLPQTRPFHNQLRWALIAYTALTIILWLFLGRPYTPIGYLDKAIELALIALLWLEGRSSTAPRTDR